ncbi:3-ketosteroid 9alpha-monooxygenase subunit A [Amycolatopsis arida]|uniref:Rieske-type oxygenase n=1 Tax=Amycolatopsis arida TaxID=587909 RepID=A0A1I5VPA3_9PSEU|nr:Rieske 2Fe-2S domain-containing protein [Amycolatopsis arida]TDX87960.1 3-ketosteroid 9alpha-monooxygenase subunit A [Amycolatopsis arida]SFQ08846.1 3-ketosteroid 9alpha-monooxygenase subunit A [Amycolatopsis arida]
MTSGNAVRMIDAGAPPTRFARGWHCLGLADTFKDGRPHAINAFGTKLVVFQSGDGKLNVLDGYCRHMGGDLTQGTVKGNEIACPFHDWRWAGNGRCVSIPYAKRVPLRARTRSWLTLEENKQLFVWHDPEGNPPPEDVVIPRIEGVFNGEWSNWTWDSVLIEGANCREIVDNIVDMAHFFYIHFAFPTYFKNVFEGHIATQYLNTKGRPDVGMASNYGGEENLLRSEASYFGPSYMINKLLNTYKGFEVENVLINCHYPVTANSFVLQWGVIVKKLPGVSDEQADKIAAKFAESIGVGFMQDVEIWRNKTRIDNPLLCEEDGPVYQLRRWYEQFYVDVAEVTEDMTRRFEFEVDTTRANEVWAREVEENLTRQQREQGAEAGV